MPFCTKHGTKVPKTHLKKALLTLFSLLLASNLTSCFSSESEIFGTYLLETSDNYLNINNREVYVSIDSDSLIFSFIFRPIKYGKPENGNFESLVECDKPIVDGYLCGAKEPERYGINSFELVENLDKQTQGSYPNGYRISYETKNGDIRNIAILNHIKDEDKVLIMTGGTIMDDIFISRKKEQYITKRLHKGTGKSAKSYLSSVVEGYKKSALEYKKEFEKELAEYAAKKKKKEDDCNKLRKSIKDLEQHINDCMERVGFSASDMMREDNIKHITGSYRSISACLYDSLEKYSNERNNSKGNDIEERDGFKEIDGCVAIWCAEGSECEKEFHKERRNKW